MPNQGVVYGGFRIWIGEPPLSDATEEEIPEEELIKLLFDDPLDTELETEEVQ